MTAEKALPPNPGTWIEDLRNKGGGAVHVTAGIIGTKVYKDYLKTCLVSLYQACLQLFYIYICIVVFQQ